MEGVISLCLLAMAGAPVSTVAVQTDLNWHLTSVIDEDGRQEIAAANAKDKVWRFDLTYQRDSVSGSTRIKRTYLGPTDKSFKVPHINGASTTTECTWISPPAKIQAGQEISMKVTGAVASRTHSWPEPYIGLIVQLVKQDGKGRYVSQLRTLRNADKKDMMMVGSGTGFKPFDERLKGSFPKGTKLDETLAVKVSVSSGNARSAAIYVYRWGMAP